MKQGRENSLAWSRARVPAFTLVEVMLAILLGGFVAASVAEIAVQCVRARNAAAEETSRRWERTLVQKRFEEDVASALEVPGEDRRLIGPSKDGRALVEIAGLAAAPDANSPYPRRLPAVVRYRVRPGAHDAEEKLLIREVQVLTESSPTPREEVVADDLEEAIVEFFRRDSWESAFVPSANEDAVSAVRLMLRWHGDSQPIITTVITGPPKARERQ